MSLVWVRAYHGRHAPNICASSPLGAEDDFGGAVLSGLNVVCKVVVHPAGVAEVGDLDADDVRGVGVFGLALLACGGGRGLVEGDARDFTGKVTRETSQVSGDLQGTGGLGNGPYAVLSV